MKLLNCEICEIKLRKDNTIGMCRKHRSQSKSRKVYMTGYTAENFEEIAAYKANWATENKVHINKHQNDRYYDDTQFRLRTTLRNSLNSGLRGRIKSGSVIDALGCTVEELKAHLELQFKPGMTWENHGKYGWHIDHIKPLVIFDLDNPEHFKVACHFSNLRPLWAKENLSRPKRI